MFTQGKNKLTIRIDTIKKYTFATLRNCSQIDFGSQLYQVYFVVLIALEYSFLAPSTNRLIKNKIIKNYLQDTKTKLTFININDKRSKLILLINIAFFSVGHSFFSYSRGFM
jgi:hypothetical protein